MPRGTLWTKQETAIINNVLDEHEDMAQEGLWMPLAIEYLKKADANSARSKSAIAQRLCREHSERLKTKKEAEQKKTVEEEVERALRQDKEVERLHKELMKETARLISNYNKVIDTAILLSTGVYKDGAGKDTLKLNFKELNRVLRALEPDLYQMRIDEIKGR